MTDQALTNGHEPDPFDTWRETVGFPLGFPRLRALGQPAPTRVGRAEVPTVDSSKFFLTELHENLVDEISESLGSAAIAVVTAPGHGATTLARYLFQRAVEESIIRRAIPVWVSIEDVIDASYDDMLDVEFQHIKSVHGNCRDRGVATRVNGEPDEGKRNDLRFEADTNAREVFARVTVRKIQEAIEGAVRLGIVRSLVTRPWERVLPKAYYRDLIGAQVATPNDFIRQREELTTILDGPGGLNGVVNLAPQLAGERFESLIADLNQKRNVRISLFLDLSATPLGRFYVDDEVGEYLTRPYLTVVQHFTKAVKNIEQAGAIGPQPTLPSLLDKTYFLSHGAWASFEAPFAEQEGARIEFHPYRSIDAFAMLAHHYPFTAYQWEHHRTELLAAVLDSEYVQLDRRTALSTQMAMLECEVRADLSEGGRSVSYHIRKHEAQREQLSAEDVDTLRQIRAKWGDFLRLLEDLENGPVGPSDEVER